jgi:UDP-glucose:(heptosyl)LPS alpha-1,3-glucosyltransferase
MRVALVIARLDPRAGGVEQWTVQFAAALAAAGHDVHVVAERFADQTDALPIVRHLTEPARTRWGFALAAEKALRRIDVDVIHDTGAGWHCHVFQPHGGSRQASFEQNLQLTPEWQRPLKRAVARWLPRYREFDRLARRQYARDGRLVLALSQMVAADVQRHYAVPASQVRVVYNGVDTRRFTPQRCAEARAQARQSIGAADDDLVLATVAHNFRLKGVATAIRAVPLLRAEGIPARLVVAGGGRAAPYRGLARRLGVAEFVSFCGPMADPLSCYAAADVYVQPTFYDPCSLVVLEALACGIPVVTTRFNGAGELLTAGVQGHVLSDPADAEGLAWRVRGWAEPQARRLAGAAARALAERHTLERNCAEIVAVYREAAGERRAAA